MVEPIIVENTLWTLGQPAGLRRRRGRRRSRTCAEQEFGDKGDNGRWRALDIIPTKADYVLDLIRLNSLWPLLSGLACCAIEMMSAATPINDMDRFNMFPFRASPRQADVLIVAGTLTTKMAGPLVRLWEQMPEPKWCVAMGDCTVFGRPLQALLRDGRGNRPDHARRRLRAGLPAAAGGPDLRDDEAPAADQASGAATGPSAPSGPPFQPASEQPIREPGQRTLS